MLDMKSSSIPLLVCAFLAAGTTGGTSYAFGIYGESLKQELGLKQSQLDTISSSNFCAGVLSWIPGLFVDHYGERCSMIAGGILGATALLCFWCVARQLIVIPQDLLVVTLSACGVVIFLSCALITGSVFKIIVGHTLPHHKGHAVGAAKGYVGLGSGAYSVLFESLQRKSDLDFLPMAAFFLFAAATLPALLLLPGKGDPCMRVDMSTSSHYSSLYLGLVAMAVLVIGQSIVELVATGSSSTTTNLQHNGGPDYLTTFMVPLVWFGPILGLLILPKAATHNLLPTDILDVDDDVPLTRDTSKASMSGFRDDPTSDYDVHDDDDDDDDNNNDGDDDMEDDRRRRRRRHVVRMPRPNVADLNLYQMLGTASSWLMLWTCTILVGGGTVMTNNLGQMVQALRFHPKVVPAALGLFSVAQSLGRVMTGSLSSMAQRRTSITLQYTHML